MTAAHAPTKSCFSAALSSLLALAACESGDSDSGGSVESGGNGGAGAESDGGAPLGAGGGGGVGASGVGGAGAAGGQGGEGGEGGGSSCQIVLPSPCPPGIAPGTQPDESCGTAPPSVTASGEYPFSLATAGPDDNLGCTANYPDPRSVTFGVCAEHTTKFLTSFTPTGTTPQGTPFPATLRSDCATAELCNPFSAGALGHERLAPGTYPIVIEGYGPATGTMNVQLTPFERLATVTDCCAAEQAVVDDGPLQVPSQHWLQHEYVSASDGFEPSCSDGSDTSDLAAFTIDKVAQATVVMKETNSGGWFGLRSSCQPRGTDIKCSKDFGLFTAELQPGTYYLPMRSHKDSATSSNYVALDLILDAPPTPTTNLDCASSQPLPLDQFYYADRIVGGTPDPDPLTDRYLRYYTFTLPSAGNVIVALHQYEKAGQSYIELRGDCANTASVISDVTAFADTTASLILNGLPAGTYSLVVRSDEGVKYWMFVDTN